MNENVNKIVTLSWVDYDKEFVESLEVRKDGFIIDDKISYTDFFNKNTKEEVLKITSEDSIFSYKYGISLTEEEDILVKMYSCKCGRLYGRENLHNLCRICETEVVRSESKSYGWLILDHHKTLHPYFCYLLSKTKYNGDTNTKMTLLAALEKNKLDFSKKDILTEPKYNVLEEFVNKHLKTSKDLILPYFKEHKELPPVFLELLSKKSYRGGAKPSLMEALDRNKLEFTWNDLLYNPNIDVLEEFILKYMKNSKDLILKYKDRLFTSKIMVMSKNYRFIKVTETLNIPVLDMHDTNKFYIEISNTVKVLNEDKFGIEEIIVPRLKTIVKAQASIVNLIWEEIASTKKAVWRAEIYGRRFPNSARLIIEPIINSNIHSIDVVQLPLDIFRVIFPNDIKKILKKKKINPRKIHNYLDPDYVLTPDERKFVRDEVFPLVEAPYIYINREPSMYMTSILGMRVHSLIDEMVLRVPFFILPAIVGDFDGDVLATIAWDTPKERQRIYETIGPQVSVINTETITYNNNIGPNNNTAVLLYKGFTKDSILKEVIENEQRGKD